MHALFCTLFSYFGSAQIIEIGKDLTELQSNVHRVSEKKTSTHIIGYKLRNSCLILIIFDTNIPHILTSHNNLV